MTYLETARSTTSKWDMNRNITKLEMVKFTLETKMQSHAYILGLYEVVFT